MAPKAKIAFGIVGLAVIGGALVAVQLDRTSTLKTASVWIGPTPDTDRALNASPDAQAVLPVRSDDPAKAQMAASPANAAPLSIVPHSESTQTAASEPPTVLRGEPPADASRDAAPVSLPRFDDKVEAAPLQAPTPSASADEAASTPVTTDVAQVILPVPPRIVAAPTLPPKPAAPVQSVQMTKPPLDTSPTPAPPPAVSQAPAVQPAAANALSGGAVFTGTSGRDLAIEINRGALVRLSKPADTVFVANPDIADIQVKSPRMIYVFGKKAGETVLYAVDSDDNVLLNTRVKVSHNLAAFRTALRSAAPTSSVEVSTVGDSLVLSGDVGSPVQAENVRRLAARFAPGDGAVVNQMRVTAPNQINLRVRIAEVAREDLKQFGINWDAAFNIGGFAFGLFTGNPVVVGDFIFGGPNAISRRANNVNNIYAGTQGSNYDINGLIDALATENLITVLAEPNLTAMSGETANFLAGGEFPIPVAQSGNANAITIEFKKFGVGLAFTPTILENGRVNLKVRPEVSQLSTVGSVQATGFNIPSLTTRRAETTVELSSGQSFAIAGLLQNASTQDVNKVPFLGDVPILGALFKSDRYRRNETELVIVVTPYLVNPVSANTIAAPTDGFVPPTDGQRILYGSTYGQGVPEGAPVVRGPDGNALIGPAGFQLD